MAQKPKIRDYRLSGPTNQLAQQKGLASTDWYQTPISRKTMKELTKRKDGPAIRDTLMWFVWLIGAGILAYRSWGTWWAIPAFALYGMAYTPPADSRWHECSHGTPFKTTWMNEIIYHLASFMTLRPATAWRWSHQRHHSDTYIAGRDPEMGQRPTILRAIYLSFVNFYGPRNEMKRIFINALSRMDDDQCNYIPDTAHRQVFWEARIYLLILLAVVVSCIYTRSIMPAMFIGLPLFYGVWPSLLYGLAQHTGLYEDVLDHRLNSRTIYLNPIFRFMYWNMNYHIEHHMFPMVPYHALPRLHQEMKYDCPAPNPGIWTSLKEIFSAVRKQQEDPYYVIERPLPSTANPYYYGPMPFNRHPD